MNVVCFEIEDWESDMLRSLCSGQTLTMVKPSKKFWKRRGESISSFLGGKPVNTVVSQ